MEVWFVIATVCGLLGAVIGSRKNAPGFGFLLGFLFGPLGTLVACFVDGRPDCPQCRESIQIGASICPHCRQSLRWSNDGKPRIDRVSSKATNAPPPNRADDDLDALAMDQLSSPPKRDKPLP